MGKTGKRYSVGCIRRVNSTDNCSGKATVIDRRGKCLWIAAGAVRWTDIVCQHILPAGHPNA
jgi:hypothetical protein